MDRSAVLEELDGNKGFGVKRSDIVYRHMRDPALLRYYYRVKMLSLTSKTELVGSSPTDLFIGRFGYPYVNIGPLVPPEFGDTSILGTPERWHSMSIEDIVGMRSKLVRGLYRTKVQNVENGRIEELVRDLALAERPAEAELSFSSKPFVKMTLKDEVEPFGPSARIRQFDLYNMQCRQGHREAVQRHGCDCKDSDDRALQQGHTGFKDTERAVRRAFRHIEQEESSCPRDGA